jgi:DNA-directed RNA polymerase subunit M/transcription elongation factor TFIIS
MFRTGAAYSALRCRAQELLLGIVRDANTAACIEEGAAPLLLLGARAVDVYSEKVLALASALHVNPELAAPGTPPEQLLAIASLPDSELAPHAPINKWAAAQREREKKQAAMLAAAEQEDAMEDSAFKCERCGHNVKIVQAQTRSADEGMTIFISCKNEKCGHRTRR